MSSNCFFLSNHFPIFWVEYVDRYRYGRTSWAEKLIDKIWDNVITLSLIMLILLGIMFSIVLIRDNVIAPLVHYKETYADYQKSWRKDKSGLFYQTRRLRRFYESRAAAILGGTVTPFNRLKCYLAASVYIFVFSFIYHFFWAYAPRLPKDTFFYLDRPIGLVFCTIALVALVVSPIVAFWPRGGNQDINVRVSKAADAVRETLIYFIAAMLLTRGMLSIFPSLWSISDYTIHWCDYYAGSAQGWYDGCNHAWRMAFRDGFYDHIRPGSANPDSHEWGSPDYYQWDPRKSEPFNQWYGPGYDAGGPHYRAAADAAARHWQYGGTWPDHPVADNRWYDGFFQSQSLFE